MDPFVLKSLLVGGEDGGMFVAWPRSVCFPPLESDAAADKVTVSLVRETFFPGSLRVSGPPESGCRRLVNAGGYLR